MIKRNKVTIISLGNSAHLIAVLASLNGYNPTIFTTNKEKAASLGK